MPKPLSGDETMQPLLPRERVMVAVNHHPKDELQCARTYGLGVEVQTFGMPDVLAQDYSGLLADMAAQVAELDGLIGVHGPFIDTPHPTPDLEIRDVVRKRYLEAFDIAGTLGAEYVLVHSQYNSMVRIKEFPEIYHRLSMEFWPELLEEAALRDLSIYIENMFDADPEPMRRVAETIDSERFRLCLDIAHAAIYSEHPFSYWINTFGEYLAHIHINDCDGFYDQHKALGEGKLDLDRAIRLLKDSGLPLSYVLETDNGGRLSAEYLGLEPIGQG